MFTWIANIFNKFVRACKAFLAVAIPIVTQVILGQLKDFALEVVKELAGANLSNEEKRKIAFERIKQYAISVGISISDSLLNTLIELAVQAWKNEK